MRVLVLVEACGGVARHVADLCAGLKGRGIDVHLIYSPQRADAVLAAGLQRLARLGVPARAIAMGPRPGPADLRAWCAIRRYLREHGPFDIIHGHSSKGGALARLLIGSAGAAGKVYTPHAFVTMNPCLGRVARRFYRGVEHWLGGLGEAVIATSPAELEHARTFLRIPGDRLFLVPNGIELPAEGEPSPRGELRRRWGVGADDLVIGTVARLVPQKAPDLLVRAFAGVARSHRGVRLVMVGDGPLRQDLERQAVHLGVAEAVVFAGYVDDPRVMSAFDIFALASRYEGFPYVLLDALAAGLPVVTTAVGGAEMAVEPGGNGYVVPVGGERELTEALARLIANSDQRRRMGDESLARARNFSAVRMVQDTVAIYEMLCRSD